MASAAEILEWVKATLDRNEITYELDSDVEEGQVERLSLTYELESKVGSTYISIECSEDRFNFHSFANVVEEEHRHRVAEYFMRILPHFPFGCLGVSFESGVASFFQIGYCDDETHVSESLIRCINNAFDLWGQFGDGLYDIINYVKTPKAAVEEATMDE